MQPHKKNSALKTKTISLSSNTFLPEEFLVVSQLDYKRNIEDVLKAHEGSSYTRHENKAFKFLQKEQCTWSHLVKMKGTRWPRCMASLLGPRPVYKKNFSPFSTWSRITCRQPSNQIV
jgi:hypothetical protein